MATWCLLSSIIRRLKNGQQTLDAALKLQIRANKSQSQKIFKMSQACCIGSTSFQTRQLHTSDQYYGKRLPSGVPQRRPPLKTKQRIKLDRVSVHNEMTIAQLAAAMSKPVDHVYEVLLYIPDTEHYDHDGAALIYDPAICNEPQEAKPPLKKGLKDESALDISIINKVVKKSGMVPEPVKQKVKKEEKNVDIVRQPPPDPSVLVKRPPVVTIMGHVDHGKTTLLDQLRQSNIVDKEFGGITQHIGAFLVTLKTGESICFLDTPGHAAFSAMRSRGAHLTDIVVLVVAADDGVMQQTIESIHHAQDAGVPVIIAINKIDKNNADVERTKQMLLEHQMQLEEFGGDIQAVPISALQGTNLLELQEAIVTQAELMNLQGDPVGLVEGSVVEARLDDKRGRLVTAVIQRGTLKKGDYLIAGKTWAKVRAMFNDHGSPIKEASPGTPVEILGWKETPPAGEEILQAKTESEVKAAVAWRQNQKLQKKQEEDVAEIQAQREEHSQEHRAQLWERRQKGLRFSRRKGPREKESVDDDEPHFSLVLKGDVDGSVDAILGSLDTYNSKKCQLDIIHFGVGNVTESDVEMAEAFDGEIYAFNVQVPDKVAALAKSKNVPIRSHNIIYRLFEELIEGLNKKLPLIQEDVVLGEAKVLQVFAVTLPNKKKSYVAGCRCVHGSMSKKFGVKVLRNDEVIYEGQITSMKHFKSEVDTVKKEQECGICVDNIDLVFQPQDTIISFEVKDIEQEIEWNPGF